MTNNMKARQTHGGKGDSDRTVDRKQYAANWDRLFKPKVAEEDDAQEIDNSDELPLGN